MKPSHIHSIIIFLFFASLKSYGQGSWYSYYSGTIGKDSISMHLHKAGHQYYGYYYYHTTGEPVYVAGEDTTEKNSIKLTSFVPDQEANENFNFSISGDAATGTWQTGKTGPVAFSAARATSPIAFDFVYTEGSVKLRPKMPESPAATFQAASIWPKSNTPQAILLKKIISETVGVKNSTEDIGRVFLRQKKQFLDAYLKDNNAVKQEDIADVSMYNLDQSDELMIVYQSAALLTLAHYTYSYAGGAHGNYGTSFITVDLKTGRKIKLNDVLLPAGKKQLPGLLEKHFRKAYSLGENDSLTDGGLFENSIKLTDNFFLTSNGIVFDYLPYEIGPFAMGEITLFIPFTELKSYLQPVFRKYSQ